MYRNYFVIRVLNDDKDGEIVSPPITSINDYNGFEIMDHVFYVYDYVQLAEYKNLQEFAELAFGMSLELFEDEAENHINRLFLEFRDSNTDELLAGLYIKEDEDGIHCYPVDITDDDEEDIEDDEFECDGNCESCEHFEDEFKDDDESDVPYYFGFEGV